MSRRGDIEAGFFNQASAKSQYVHLAVAGDRRNFVRKVYTTVALQLAATAAFATPIATASDRWLEVHSALFLFSTFGFLLMGLVLCCCGNTLMRQHPTNLFILAGFTLLESVSVGFFCAMYEAHSVLWCLAATGAIAGALTLFAATTKVDVTGMGGFLRATSLGLLLLGLMGLIFRLHMLQVLYACVGAVLFSGYIVYDTQMVVAGKHQEKKFSLDDYALAALSIYMDVVRVFMFILRMFGEERRQRR